ncbi:cyclic nucleotide-binding domain-containing protein [Kitasatospora sp. NA04385]|uniref:Crp/Fnr family transcriptional regulator n=1 Tax=Kitasatospora sp. NA04385 TaxID=2742135 RepID=UPI00158FAA20|nr:cyclic nucleotide-binding domain-containing protein [Kitasatospora sp. NA04385]QKW20437.1 cyclic nucleotide-binding domain-containing protein [Kitasatospora sp. NA04385]
MHRTSPPSPSLEFGPWRALIGTRAWRTVTTEFEQVTCAPGRRLLTQGEPGPHVVVLLEGLAWVEQGTSHGRVSCHLRGPGDLLGEAALFGGPRTATVAALTACRVVRIPVTELRRLLHHPDLELSVAALLHERQRIDQLMRQFEDPLTRLAVGVHPAVRVVDEARRDFRATRLALSNAKVSRWLGVRHAAIVGALGRSEFTENFANHHGALEVLRRDWILRTASLVCR